MKKILYTLMIMLTMSIATEANNKIIVQGTSKVEVYDNITAALTAAATGDTIYLCDGTFESISLKKLVYLRGTGKSTIAGNLSIEIGGNPTPTDAVIEGLVIEGQLAVTKKVTNLVIRQCTFTSTNFAADMPNALIDRCYATDIMILNAFTNEMTVRNTKIKYLGGTSTSNNGATFINCNIYELGLTWEGNDYKKTAGIFKNCILFSSYLVENGIYGLQNSTLTNCLLSTYYSSCVGSNIDSSSTTVNCYYVGILIVYNTILPDKDVTSYKGDDHTQVGIFGGTTPFDLNPAVPQVSSASIEVDQAGKKLKIQLAVEAE